jgi:hypothetical protein
MAKRPKERLTILVDAALFDQFKAISIERGHTMTWYLLGCIKEIVTSSRREDEKKGGEARKIARPRKTKSAEQV